MFRSVAIVIQAALDTMLPRKERIVRIDHYAPEDVPVSAVEHEMCGVHITTLLRYREPIVEDLIRALKYDGSTYAAMILAHVLAEYLQEEIGAMRVYSTKEVLLVPVPLHSSREEQRGFNQVRRILDHLPEEMKSGPVSRILEALVRIRATPQQTQLSRDERITNVAGAFALSDPHATAGTHIILIDDVTTTGATLSEAAKPLEKTPVTFIALAHA